MNIKILTTSISALCLLVATAAAAQGGMGTVNTLDLDERRISIDYEDLIIDDQVRVQTVSGMIRTTDHLAENQHVDYKLNRFGRVSEIRIYYPDKLLEQGFYTEKDVNH